MNKLDRINSEKERLLSIFSDLNENELQVAEGLICQAAFMLVTLEDLQIAIQQNGSVGEYKNGKDQYGTKQSAELQAYNQTLRSYNSVIGKLLKIVPHKPEHKETVQDHWKQIQEEADSNYVSEKKARENQFLEALSRGEVNQNDYYEFMKGSHEQ